MARSGKARAARAAIVAALAVVLALLCFSVTGAQAGKLGGSGGLVEEKVTEVKKVDGPAGGRKSDRKDGGSKERPPKPPKVTQTSLADLVGLSGTTPGGRKLAATAGRSLKALGDPCSITVRNRCKSRQTFRATFAYYSYDGPSPGWVAEGDWAVRYGTSFKFNGNQVLYVRTTTNLRPTLTTGSAQSFCVASSPFTILDGDDGVIYDYDNAGITYDEYDYCYQAGGWYQGNFWAPRYCGITFTYTNC